jgi:hypothetical protein
VEVVKLWCGTTDKCTDLIERIFTLQPLTAFECLADAGEVSEETVSKIVGAFEAHLGEPDEKDSIAKAFAAVAADSRSRGDAVFRFLEDTLKTDLNPTRRHAAMTVLSLH